jgi:hypothetical protein
MRREANKKVAGRLRAVRYSSFTWISSAATRTG